jgi:dTDP-4-dehydrorhamnose reductase
MRIAVLGAQGQLGAAIVHELRAAHEVTPFGHADVDITDHAAVTAMTARVRPDVIINGAAYNEVDKAEDEPVAALNVNAFALRSLARAAADTGATLVHYSTDFVFDGTASAPYTEDDRPNPSSVYASSKLLGEWFAADAPKSYILRVESLFGQAPGSRPAKGSVAMIMKTLAAGGEPRVFEDRTISPTYVVDAARATRALLERRAPFGLYHCVNSGRCTWLELARDVARLLGVAARPQPVRIADVALKAARPQYCALSNAKLAAVGITMPTWQDALARYLERVPTLPPPAR